MFKNKIQKRQEEKRSVISFDTLTDNGNEVEIKTLYNVYNTLYSSDKLVNMNPNMTSLDVINRRICLEEIFKNRVAFLLNNAISEFANTVHCSCPDIINEYPFIFDIHSYMAEISGSTILDYTNLLCSKLYNYAMAEHIIIDNISLVEYTNMVNLVLQQTMGSIYNALATVSLEAVAEYYNAGLPDIRISFDGE